MKNLIFILFVFLLSVKIEAQDYLIQGKVNDVSTHEPLSFANIYVKEIDDGAVSDENGEFDLILSEGLYHFRISHVGCEQEIFYIQIRSDTSIIFEMHHHNELLDEVTIHGDDESVVHTTKSISNAVIEERLNESIAELASKINGVTLLRTGTTATKPLIHGLYGNRLGIVNNGIVQAGQTWGNDHAPEIDPYSADHISVVKDAGLLAYNTGGFGAMLLVEPGSFSQDPHLHGSMRYLYGSNGRAHNVSSKLEKKVGRWGVRLKTTYRKAGDFSTPDYYLTNTGKNELNGALFLENKTQKGIHRFFLSSYNQEVGILRGSHIGNTTDLEDALTRDIPFFTSDKFSYTIDAPRQEVSHNMAKYEGSYLRNNNETIRYVASVQRNNRQEFDVRRGNRSAKPSLSLLLYNIFSELQYLKESNNERLFKSGIQYNLLDNTNNPETGISPLIPDYRTHQLSMYMIYNWPLGGGMMEIGSRYDYRNRLVLPIENREFTRVAENWYNASAVIGWSGNMGKGLGMKINTTLISRAPEINELYSNGLHQGISGIEEGDRGMKSENAVKAITELNYNFGDRVFAQIQGYVHFFKGYINLLPTGENRLTIRGAFPVFSYIQTDAILSGLDANVSWDFAKGWKVGTGFSYINGQDTDNGIPLAYIPPVQWTQEISWEFGSLGHSESNRIFIESSLVKRQTRFVIANDIIAPPPGYFLLNTGWSGKFNLRDLSFSYSLKVENLLNEKYRNYLNRQRYFADELGRNITIGVGLNF